MPLRLYHFHSALLAQHPCDKYFGRRCKSTPELLTYSVHTSLPLIITQQMQVSMLTSCSTISQKHNEMNSTLQIHD